jgi:hypothetical protein
MVTVQGHKHNSQLTYPSAKIEIGLLILAKGKKPGIVTRTKQLAPLAVLVCIG